MATQRFEWYPKASRFETISPNSREHIPSKVGDFLARPRHPSTAEI